MFKPNKMAGQLNISKTLTVWRLSSDLIDLKFLSCLFTILDTKQLLNSRLHFILFICQWPWQCIW